MSDAVCSIILIGFYIVYVAIVIYVVLVLGGTRHKRPAPMFNWSEPTWKSATVTSTPYPEMTTQEAITILRRLRQKKTIKKRQNNEDLDLMDALDIAIGALVKRQEVEE